MVRLYLIGIIALILPTHYFSQEQSAQKNPDRVNQLPVKVLEQKISHMVSDENYPEALILMQLALRKYKESNQTTKAGKMYLRQGRIHMEINDFKNAMKSFLKGQDLLESGKSYPDLVDAKLEIGELYGKLGQFDNAFKSLNDVLTINRKIKIKRNELIRTYQSLGIVFGSSSELDSALHYFEKAKNLFSDTLQLGYAGLLNNIGAIYSKREENDRALNYYQRALRTFSSLPSPLGVAVTQSNIAFIYKKQGKYHQALDLYHQAISYYESSKSYLYLKDNLLNMSDIYSAIGKYKEALDYNNQYLEINEEITNAEVLTEVGNLQMQYKIRKKEHDVKILEQKNKIASIRQQLLIFGMVALVILAFLFIRNYRSSLHNNKLKQEVLRQEKINLNKEIEFKNKELEVFAIKFIEKNELLNRLKADVKAIPVSDPMVKNKVMDLSLVINNHLSAEKDRIEFGMQLDQTHHAFLSRLNNLFPNLSENEKRLCSLLVLNLKIKDIAIILNISPDSVKKSRYRLRQKLNLTTDENLTGFLLSL